MFKRLLALLFLRAAFLLSRATAFLFLCATALVVLSATASATTTVTGNVKNLGTGAVSAGTFVRFYLRGCAGNQPRVNGTAIIAPTLGNVYYFDFPVQSNGSISGMLYSTRDATGNNGGDIECGGSLTAVWYGMQVFVNGKGGPETPIHAKNTATIDVSSIVPLLTNPVVTAPTGDSTYARLDGANQPFLGFIQAPAFVPSTRGDRQIILQNPDFEGSTVIPPPGWGNNLFVGGSITSGTTLAYETSSPAPGKNQSLKMSTTIVGGQLLNSASFSVVPGDTYSVTGQVKSDGTGVPQLDLAFRDKNGAGIADIIATGTTSTSWNTVTSSGTVPANAAFAFFRVTNQSATQPSTVWFDTLSIQKTNFPGFIGAPAFVPSTRGDRQIILQNPDFEGSSILPPPGWGLNGTATFSYETSAPAPGKLQSLKVSSAVVNGGAISVINFSVVPGETYSITAALKSDGSGTAFAGIAAYDKNHTFISTFANAQTGSTSWTTVTGSGTVPANAVQAQVILLNVNATQPSTVWFDQISIQKTNFPAPLYHANGSASAPSLSFLSQASTGLWFPGAGNIALVLGGTNRVNFGTPSVALNSGSPLNWSSGDPTVNGFDIGLSRSAAGTIAVGNGLQGDHTGTLAANKVTDDGAGNFFLAQNTHNAFVTFNQGHFAWSATGLANGTVDTALTRGPAGQVNVGNGADGDSSGTLKDTITNSVTGYQINGTATNGHCLVGNGTNYVDGTCAGLIAPQISTTQVTANASVTTFQNLQSITFGANTFNAVGKMFTVTSAGSFTPVSNTETVSLGFTTNGGANTFFLNFTPPNTSAFSWSLNFVCVVTIAGASGAASCAPTINISQGVQSSSFPVVGGNMTGVGMGDLTAARTFTTVVAFSTASTTNSMTGVLLIGLPNN